jgi:hypothetical protein
MVHVRRISTDGGTAMAVIIMLVNMDSTQHQSSLLLDGGLHQ